MRKAYISGAISGFDFEEVKAKFELAAINLRAEGFEPISPLLNGLDQNNEWIEHMEIDLDILAECDLLVKLSDWKESKGCRIESKFAEHMKIPSIQLTL